MRVAQKESELGLPLLQRIARHRYGPGQLIALDVLAAVLLLLVSIYAGPHKTPRLSGSVWHTVNGVVDALTAATVLLRRRFPRTTLAVLLPIALIVLCVRADGPAVFYVGMAVYSVVAVCSRRTGLWVVTGVVIASVICIVIGGGSLEASSLTGVVAILLLGWLAAENARAGRRYARAQAERQSERIAEAEAVQTEQIQQAIAGERVKIARDLHDIVAHAMSVIAVRSGVARMVIDEQPEQAREALSIIETTTRRTLHEMRLLVGMLRDTDGPAAELTPVPGVEDLARLMHEISLAGVAVDLEVTGDRRPLSPAADLSAYRIIQEALTNVVRHAGPTTAHVQLTYRPTELDIEIRDDGPAPGPAQTPPLGRSDTGHGIIGMRERTAMFGGTLHAEPSDHGFRVTANLRIDD